MKVVVAEVQPWEIETLRDCVPKKNSTFLSGKFTIEEANKYSDVELLCISLYSQINSHVLARTPKLKYIITRSTGFDQIDVAACRKRGVKVLNVPAYGSETVAEHTFALILALTRKIPESIERTKEGSFSQEGLQGVDLAGKTLGIVGLGKIGTEVAKRARAFDMQIIAYTPKKDVKLVRQLRIKYVNLNELLKKSDIITLHAPLTEETKHLINKANVSSIKRGAYLINTARGGLVETEGLLKAIDSKILAGAAVDVLEGEMQIKEEHEVLKKQDLGKKDMKQLIENRLLLRERNVLITPHIAFYTKEALNRILETSCDNIASCLRGKPINLVR